MVKKILITVVVVMALVMNIHIMDKADTGASGITIGDVKVNLFNQAKAGGTWKAWMGWYEPCDPEPHDCYEFDEITIYG